MDQALFILGLVLFAALYLGVFVYLLWVLAITIFVMILFLAVRYKNIAENYPYNASETLMTVLMTAVIWTVFVIVGPKPIPFFGSSFFYIQLTQADFAAVAAAVIVFTVVVFIILAIIVPHYERKGAMGGGGGGGDITVGAG